MAKKKIGGKAAIEGKSKSATLGAVDANYGPEEGHGIWPSSW